MRYDKLEAADEVVKRLFDPRYSYKKAYIPLELKYAYLQHYLETKWTEIVGKNLARSCSIEKIVGNELYIRTASSLLANELYMMQSLFLQKINAFLLGRIIIKKVYFHTGGFIRRQQAKKQAEEQAQLPKPEYTRCPRCGARMEKGPAMCSICEREERDRLRGNITELLRIQPWLSYGECQAFYKCDRILFNAVRDGLKGYYFEKVRQGFATKKDELMAVLFLSEKQPEEITTKIYENTLAYLRKDAPMQRFRR
ncbi:DciA family protein [Phascolarctobacterium sp.]